MYEGEEGKLSFTPNTIAGRYNLHNDELYARMRELFEVPNIEGMIVEQVKASSLVIVPQAVDPAASYPATEIFADPYTVVEGDRSALQEVVPGDRVNVWIRGKGSPRKIADRIWVQSQ